MTTIAPEAVQPVGQERPLFLPESIVDSPKPTLEELEAAFFDDDWELADQALSAAAKHFPDSLMRICDRFQNHILLERGPGKRNDGENVFEMSITEYKYKLVEQYRTLARGMASQARL